MNLAGAGRNLTGLIRWRGGEERERASDIEEKNTTTSAHSQPLPRLRPPERRGADCEESAGRVGGALSRDIKDEI